jgi:hypothetical protein
MSNFAFLDASSLFQDEWNTNYDFFSNNLHSLECVVSESTPNDDDCLRSELEAPKIEISPVSTYRKFPIFDNERSVKASVFIF